MSALTQCNYCSLRAIKHRAVHEHKHVHTCMGGGRLSGVDVYVIPVTMDAPKGKITEASEFHKQYWVAWFMEITDRCVC